MIEVIITILAVAVWLGVIWACACCVGWFLEE